MDTFKPVTEFNLRVYALILNNNNQVLVSDEMFRKKRLVKFPGGGMHPGEGTLECLHREAQEEFGQDILILDHFYTTDYFIRTLFFEHKQLIAIYYKAQFSAPPAFKISTRPFDFTGDSDGTQSFRWLDISADNLNQFTFEADQKVMSMLCDLKKL